MLAEGTPSLGKNSLRFRRALHKRTQALPIGLASANHGTAIFPGYEPWLDSLFSKILQTLTRSFVREGNYISNGFCVVFTHYSTTHYSLFIHEWDDAMLQC